MSTTIEQLTQICTEQAKVINQQDKVLEVYKERSKLQTKVIKLFEQTATIDDELLANLKRQIEIFKFEMPELNTMISNIEEQKSNESS